MKIIDAKRQQVSRTLDPKMAMTSGQLQCDNLPALLKFEESFKFSSDVIDAAAQDFKEATGQEKVMMADSDKFVFEHLLSNAFVGGVEGPEALQFQVMGGGEFGVRFDAEEVEVTEGKLENATANVYVGSQVMGGMAMFKAMLASAEAKRTRDTIDANIGTELSDAQLVEVSGGKSDSGCTSDSCGGDILVHLSLPSRIVLLEQMVYGTQDEISFFHCLSAQEHR